MGKSTLELQAEASMSVCVDVFTFIYLGKKQFYKIIEAIISRFFSLRIC